MITKDVLMKIIKYAAKAPSGHNTQPWKFKIGNDRISILPDFTRALPVVDSDNHALYISLGCALENLIIAANQFDCETKTTIHNSGNETFIQIDLYQSEEIKKTDLYNFIEKRQVTRNKYSTEKIQKEFLRELFDDILDKCLQVKLFLSKTEIENLTPYIIEGSNLQFNNKAFVKELVSWFRFSEKEVLIEGDGLWSASMGLPNMGRCIGNFVMKNFVSAKSEAKRWKKIISKSAGFALFMVKTNDHEHWIKLGQAFQRFGLLATKMNINHAHVNMPCEELPVREKMIQNYQLNEYTPLLLIRFGYSNPLPYSYRRNINEILSSK
ncbi:MAG: hypothetical protein K8R41_13455 [Bacteroidales bacterium]|nr:hypothetical protein [Bacteroidales bacterium]